MFIEVTRVYKLKGTKADANGKVPLKSQKFTIAISAIESVRPSNRLGHPEHRSTITLASGGEVDAAQTYQQIRAAMGGGL